MSDSSSQSPGVKKFMSISDVVIGVLAIVCGIGLMFFAFFEGWMAVVTGVAAIVFGTFTCLKGLGLKLVKEA